MAKILLFGLFVYAAFQFMPLLLSKFKKGKDQDVSMMTLMMIVGLSFALISEMAGVGAILGAFIAGVMLQKAFPEEEGREREMQNLRLFVFSFIIPFFFFNVGRHFRFSAIFEAPVLAICVLLAALIGKVGGTLIAKPFVRLSWKQLYLVGWGMNSRGVMELVLAKLALEAGIIDRDLYASIVLMAVLTTLMFPLVLRRMIAKYPTIMEDEVMT